MLSKVVRLAAYTAHFRDPRTNTAKIGLPSRTLRCPPPCTIHGLISAAGGRWVDTRELRIGWRLDYTSIVTDFQTSQLPQRRPDGRGAGAKLAPVEREVLAFPVLSILLISGVSSDIFVSPVNPLSLGRSEDLIVEKLVQSVTIKRGETATISGQCLPVGIGTGTIYNAPLYFVGTRRPVGMVARVDACETQTVATSELMQIEETEEAFYVWDFSETVGEKRQPNCLS